jgi:signal transduction histidine kinase
LSTITKKRIANVSALQVSRNGTVWVSSNGNLLLYDKDVWTRYDTPDIPINNSQILDLLETTDGTLWVIGRERVDRFDPSHWTTFQDLNLQCETPDHSLWFISEKHHAVQFHGTTWQAYNSEDGLLNKPSRLFTTQSGELWASGMQDSLVALSRFNGTRWITHTYSERLGIPNQAPGSPRSFLEAEDSSIWMGLVNVGGVLQFDGKTWIHHPYPKVSPFVYGLGQTSNGHIWAGGNSLHRFDGKTWHQNFKPETLTFPMIEVIYTAQTGDLWFGHRSTGAFQYNLDTNTWKHYTTHNGLADNNVQSILQTQDRSILIATSNGLSRFDGKTWLTHALPPTLFTLGSFRSMYQTNDGTLWLNKAPNSRSESQVAIRYKPETIPPETRVIAAIEEVSQPGNTTITWQGADPWHDTSTKDLQFSYRLDNEEWSPHSHETYKTLLTLSTGEHTFEVKTRDRDFNEDPTPAIVHFTVIPPVYQQAWFLALMAVLLSGIVFQTTRIIRRDRRLNESNAALSDANKELFQINVDFQQKTEDLEVANQKLQRDRAVERIRAQVQLMDKAEDFDAVLSILANDLNTVDLNFTTCGIDVLDEPENKPTLSYFETKGFRYTAYTIDPNGTVSSETYHISAPFPPVVRETIQRFVEGQPWQALTEGKNAILEVPISNYGRLRLTASDRERFAEDEITTLQDFATAIALGYVRYLDFQRIHEQTERKSRFLSAISHELRTPLTAIKGYSDNLLEGIAGELTERQQRGVSRIGSNSEHMLSLVNDLLDIARIEAGRVEINPEPFDIHGLIISCCDTVAPLVKPGVELTQDMADDIGEANTDQGRVRQILINLLSNALKFTEQGEVKVTGVIQEKGDRRQEAGESGVGQILEISVSDTGTGIPQDDLATIFEEFKQVKGSDIQHRGTGLGLPITKGFAELLGGFINVESEVGKGSTFTVKIPTEYRT